MIFSASDTLPGNPSHLWTSSRDTSEELITIKKEVLSPPTAHLPLTLTVHDEK